MKTQRDNVNSINIIGDVGGRFDELLKLLDKMPKADLILAVGDLMDRGPKSRQVITWFMGNADKAEALYGNHDDMMVKDSEWWEMNGGDKTIESYGGREFIPKSHIEWLSKRPLYYKTDNLVVTHAPITQLSQLPKKLLGCENPELGEEGDFIWNRYAPMKPLGGGYFHVYGHNHKFREHTYGTRENLYAVCIDATGNKELMGMHWNGNPKEIQYFKEDFVIIPEPLW